MRRITMADLAAVAQFLARRPASDRPALLDRLISQAQAADCYSRRLRRPHPDWGDGSLLSRAMVDPCPAVAENDDYWDSFSLVAAAIAARKSNARRATLGLCDDRPIC